MRASIAYFAGAGTIAAAIAIGLGGGLIAGNIMSPQLPKGAAAASKLERRASAETVGASTIPARNVAEGAMPASGPVPYLAEAQRAAFGAPFASNEPQADSTQANTARDSKPADGAPARSVRAGEQQAPGAQASPEYAYAKAKESDVKREAAERRRLDRRQRWAERRGRDWHEQTDWGDVDRRVRDADSRDYGSRRAYGVPHIRIFGAGDDD